MSILRSPRTAFFVSLLLAAAFAGAGIAKVLRVEFEVEAFKLFQLPIWLMVQVGVVEIIGAALLVSDRTATLGAIIGVAIMVVAIPVHFFADEAQPPRVTNVDQREVRSRDR